MAESPTLSVCVAAFNEAENLEPVLRELDSALQGLKLSYEIIVVDDGSTDGTGAIADKLTGEIPRARVIHHGRNLGLGGFYRTAFAQARGDLVTFIPADGQFPPANIGRFLPAMEKADMALGYLPKQERPLIGIALSIAEKMLYRLLFGPMPRFQGLLMFKRKLLDQLELKSDGRGWTVLLELILRASRAGCAIVNIPTEMRPRLSGRSKVNNMATLWDNLKQALVLYRDI